jgi:hypothetical protein
MIDFNYKNWLRQTKTGPYQKSILTESENQLYKVIGKSKNHLVAYPDPQGGYTKSELESWYQKGYELSQSRQVEFATSKEDAEVLAGENIDEDTYTQTYDQDGPENPSPEGEEFQEGVGDWGENNWYASTEFTQGWEAYDKVDRTKCPYPQGSTEYHDWMDGWMSRAAKVQQSHDEETYEKEIGESSISGIEDTNTAIEYYADAEVTGFDNSQMPPRYADTTENTLTADVDLESSIEDKVMTLFPKYFQDLKVTPYRKFSYDPDIETSQKPVVIKYGYNGWEPMPNDLLGYLSSKYNVKQRYGYDTEDVQYIVYPK